MRRTKITTNRCKRREKCSVKEKRAGGREGRVKKPIGIKNKNELLKAFGNIKIAMRMIRIEQRSEGQE